MEISGDGALDDPEHPTYLAFDWIVDEDPLHVCPEDSNLLQRYALVVLYFYTEGDSWIKCRRDGLAACTAENFLSAFHECEWGGVTCDPLYRVQRLNLDETNLKGLIPKELALLDYLEELDFDSNRLTGPVPGWAGSLRYLERLDLDRNSLSGPIPEELYDSTTLRFVDLDRNIISGSLSTKIGQMSQLNFLQIDFNQMIGTIPSELGDLAELQYFSIMGNGFNDNVGIPESMCGHGIQLYANCDMCTVVGDCCTACLPSTN
jgi:Leucine-rich repeat (LRR) protein